MRLVIWVINGTRPEALKVASLAKSLAQVSRLEVLGISTYQHEELLRNAVTATGLETFNPEWKVIGETLGERLG